MKKIALLASMLILPSLALAEGNFPMAGCGPWYLIFGHNDNSKGAQLGVWALNSFVFPGAYLSSSMSSGTSGCNEKGELRWARSAEIFAEANFDTLKKELAAGQGEYVTTFSSLLGVSEERIGDFNQLMKERYTSLIPSESATYKDLMENVSHLMSTYQNRIG